MLNPRDPRMPGEYERIRAQANEMRDAAQRVTMHGESSQKAASTSVTLGGGIGRGVAFVVLLVVACALVVALVLTLR